MASTTSRRRPFSRRIWFGPDGLLDLGDLPRRDPSRRRLDQKIAQALRGAQAFRQPHHHVEAAIAVDHPRDHAPVRQPAELIDHGGRLHAIKRGARIIDTDFELRNQYLLLDLHVGEAGNGRKLRAQFLGRVAHRVEIVAEDLQRDLGADAGQHVVEPVRDRLADIDRQRQHAEPWLGYRRRFRSSDADDGLRSTSSSLT